MNDPRIYWYNLPQNSGYQSRPNNEGIKRAKGENYHDVGPQPLYIGRILEEPDYINKEMAAMLIRAHQKLGKFPSFSRIKMQIDDYVRSMLLKRDLDPARIKFWLGKGGQIRIWRKRHGLKDPVSLDTTEKSTV